MSKELATTGAGALTIVPSGNIAEIIAENLGGGSITAFDLDRIKIPAGGGVAFEVPTLEGTDMQKSLEGIIVYHQDQNAYWPEPISAGSIPPSCAARDGRVGVGDPGGLCAKCPLNQFGSDLDGGKGKACKNSKALFLLRPGALLPTAIFLPPTSIPVARQYLLRLTSGGVPFYAVTTRVSLVRTKNADGVDYAKVELATVPVNPAAETAVERITLPASTVADVRRYREAIIPLLSAVTFDQGDVEA